MARITNRAVTFTEVKSMAAETTGTYEYLIALKTIPTDGRCMTREDLVEYVNVDTIYSANGKNFSSYTDTRLVPFELIRGTVRDCVAASMSNQGFGVFKYFVDLGTTTGIVRLNYDAVSVPDAFIIEWNGTVVDSGWVGSDTYTVPATRTDNTGNPSTGEGSIYIKKTSASPNIAEVTVDASAVSGTGWSVQQVNCPTPFEIRLLGNTDTTITVEWDAFTASAQANPTPRATPKYVVTYLVNESPTPYLGSKDVAIGTTSTTITGLPEGTSVNNIEVFYKDEYGGSIDTTNNVSATTDAPVTPVSVSPTYVFYGSNGGSFTLTISNASGSWTATDNASWLSESPTSGTGSSTTVTVSTNNDPFLKAGRVIISNNGNTAFCDVDIDAGAGCLIHGSQISMLDGTYRNIEDLIIGDTLLGANIQDFEDTNDLNHLREQKLKEMNFVKSTSVITKIEPLRQPRVISLNDGLFTATPHHTHVYKQNDEWVFMPLGMLEEGDTIMDMDGNEIVIYKRDIINEEHTVYKLTLESPNHTFFGNNILTHNVKQL